MLLLFLTVRDENRLLQLGQFELQQTLCQTGMLLNNNKRDVIFRGFVLLNITRTMYSTTHIDVKM